MLSAFSTWSLPAFRWSNTHRGTWPVATASYHRPNHSSEFRIGSCQCRKTWLYRKTDDYKSLSNNERIKIHHSCSWKQSAVHTKWSLISDHRYIQIHWRHCIPCIACCLVVVLVLDLDRPTGWLIVMYLRYVRLSFSHCQWDITFSILLDLLLDLRLNDMDVCVHFIKCFESTCLHQFFFVILPAFFRDKRRGPMSTSVQLLRPSDLVMYILLQKRHDIALLCWKCR